MNRLHFIEQMDRQSSEIVEVEVWVADFDATGSGSKLHAGTLRMPENDWARLWAALVQSTPAFERDNIELLRTGPFR